MFLIYSRHFNFQRSSGRRFISVFNNITKHLEYSGMVNLCKKRVIFMGSESLKNPSCIHWGHGIFLHCIKRDEFSVKPICSTLKFYLYWFTCKAPFLVLPLLFFLCPVVDFSRQENWNFTIFNTYSIRFLTFTAVRLWKLSVTFL